MEQYDFGDDPAALTLLDELILSVDQLRSIQAALVEDGLVVAGSTGQRRAHPLLAERVGHSSPARNRWLLKTAGALPVAGREKTARRIALVFMRRPSLLPMLPPAMADAFSPEAIARWFASSTDEIPWEADLPERALLPEWWRAWSRAHRDATPPPGWRIARRDSGSDERPRANRRRDPAQKKPGPPM
jgi:hypothetical protein